MVYVAVGGFVVFVLLAMWLGRGGDSWDSGSDYSSGGGDGHHGGHDHGGCGGGGSD